MGAVAKSYMRSLLVIYDFATAPFWISICMRKIVFSFLSVYGIYAHKSCLSVRSVSRNNTLPSPPTPPLPQTRARIWKLLWSPGIDSKEPIPAAWRAGKITLFLLGS
jgi:hypothetical protein